MAGLPRCIRYSSYRALLLNMRFGAPQCPFGGHPDPQPFPREPEVTPHRGAHLQFQAQPREVMVRADCLEPHRQQIVSGQNAGSLRTPQVPEGFDRLDTPAGEVLGHALDQHPAQPAAGELIEDVGGHQQDGIGTDRAGGEGH